MLTNPKRQASVVPISAAAAWRRYLEATRGEQGTSYVEIEQVAWAQLRASLDQLPVQRELGPAA